MSCIIPPYIEDVKSLNINEQTMVKKTLNIREQITIDLWDKVKRNNLRIGVPERQEENSKEKETVKDIVTEKFLDLKSVCTHILNAQSVPAKRAPNKSILN